MILDFGIKPTTPYSTLHIITQCSKNGGEKMILHDSKKPQTFSSNDYKWPSEKSKHKLKTVDFCLYASTNPKIQLIFFHNF